MKNLKSPFRAYIRIYLPSGNPCEFAEKTRKSFSDLFTPLIDEIGLQLISDVFDQYEDECHEMAGSRQPVISFRFEAHISRLDVAVDYSLFLQSLARLMDAQYSDVDVRYEVDSHP